jgi:hypothetical protein
MIGSHKQKKKEHRVQKTINNFGSLEYKSLWGMVENGLNRLK